jgi:hypothetical protein
LEEALEEKILDAIEVDLLDELGQAIDGGPEAAAGVEVGVSELGFHSV